MEPTTTAATLPRPSRPRGAGATDPVLDALLDAELATDPVARGGFINHLSMSLVAARRLGATDAELHELSDAQLAGDFLVPRARPAWLDGEAERVATTGIEAEVTRRLPELLAAPASQFFHAPIRLELAVDAGHPAQVASALRNWSDHARPLPHLPAGDGDLPFAAVVARLARHPEAAGAEGEGFAAVAGASWFRHVVAELRAHPGLLDEVAAVAVAAHTDPRDLGTLHLVTGTRAARALAGLAAPADAVELALRTAHAVAVASVAFGVAVPPEGEGGGDPTDDDLPPAAALPTWDEVERAAIATGDPHVIKLAYACRLEAAATGRDRRYRAVAARQVGR